MIQKGISTITYEVTPVQAAFLEWCKRHPHCVIHMLQIYEGVPLEVKIPTPDGIGLETVRFDKVLVQK